MTSSRTTRQRTTRGIRAASPRTRMICGNPLIERVATQIALGEDYNSKIETIADRITADRTPLDEQDVKRLKKYHDFAKEMFMADEDLATQMVNEAFLYLKLKSSGDVDPLQHGDQFGAGFS